MQGHREQLQLAPPEELIARLQLRPLEVTEHYVLDIKDQAWGCGAVE